MLSMPVGIQLYSVRDACAKDLPGVLKRLAAMGYEGVEFAGYYNYTATDLKKMLDDLGLKCCGTHTGLSTLMGDKFQATVDFNRTLANPYLIVPGLSAEQTKSIADWSAVANLFSGISQRLEPQGFYTGYHNHHTEFTPLEGQLPWDVFFGQTSPRVIMQFDTGNALHAKVEAAPFIQRYPGRALTVHLKDHTLATGQDAILGQGDVPWKTLLPLCATVGKTKWFIVEHENPNVDSMTAADGCIKGLRKIMAEL
ncbi:MAG: sugar phosphate isomerase/epimerase [Phycisphaeraceae bacterium]|nr:sugar phosphate isomerase/epimerase [Phycisphaeraceae bacterium]